jgi:hypothetical protein
VTAHFVRDPYLGADPRTIDIEISRFLLEHSNQLKDAGNALRLEAMIKRTVRKRAWWRI